MKIFSIILIAAALATTSTTAASAATTTATTPSTTAASAATPPAKAAPTPKTRRQLEEQIRELSSRLDSAQNALNRKDSLITQLRAELEQAYSSLEELTQVGQSLAPTLEQIDSNLSIWQLSRQIEDFDALSYEPDFRGEQPDSVYIARLERMNSPLNLPYNNVVRSYIIKYSERYRTQMQKIIGLCSYYFPIFEETLDRYGLPLELEAMAIIESNLNPRAKSPAGAVGLWQFTFNAGRAYGLQIDSFVDERMDLRASTDAAARYLRDAYNVFGDWALAICAYNCGFGGVRKAIARSGGKTAYWDIYPFLPKETRYYVPAMVGALYAIRYHKELGIKPVACHLPAATDTVEVRGKLHLRQVQDLVGTELGLLRDLNPQYKHDVIPDDGKTHILLIPAEDALKYIAQGDSIQRHKAEVYMSPSVMKSIANNGTGETIVYKVKQGDNLGLIAKKYGVIVAKLKQWNSLKSDLIRPGQKIYIYK